MKISDITSEFNEDNSFGKISNIDPANKKITVDKPDGSKMDLPSTAIMPDPTKPGQATVDPSATIGQLKTGEMVNTPTQEEMGDDDHNKIIVNHKEVDPRSLEIDGVDHHDRGDYADAYFSHATFMDGTPLSDAELDHLTNERGDIVNMMANDSFSDYASDAYDRYKDSQYDEAHKDTIAQGGGDVGGDATDSFISQIKDKGFERKNRSATGDSASPFSGKKLKEDDELSKWLTIAGIK
jgi:Cu/Ag efflux protein CusF